jgi:hypothetical protein
VPHKKHELTRAVSLFIRNVRNRAARKFNRLVAQPNSQITYSSKRANSLREVPRRNSMIEFNFDFVDANQRLRDYKDCTTSGLHLQWAKVAKNGSFY